MKILKFIKKHKVKIVIAIIALIILIILLKPKPVEEPSFETVSVEKRTLTNAINSTGRITTENSKNVVSQLMNYKITSVKVKVGDKVNVGDLICTFDTADLAKTVSDLEATVSATGTASNVSIESAERALQDVQRSRDSVLDPLNKQVQTLKQEYENHNSALNTAKSDLQTKQTEVKNLESQVGALTSEGNSAKLTEVQNKITSLKGEISKININIMTLEPKVNALREQYLSMQKEYDNQAATLNNQVANVQGQLDSARAQTSVSTLTVEEQITAMKKQLADTNLKATTAGTVTAVNIKPGDFYTGGVLCTIEGEENFIVETEIDEYDIADIKVGMEAIIKTDSTRDEELKGEVILVSPAATGMSSSASSGMSVMGMGVSGASSASATYTVKVAINTKNERLRLGMNAKLNIITEKSADAMAVPYDAIMEKDDGSKYIILIKDDGAEEEIAVTTGLESGFYTEISGDKIKEGMKVKLPKVDNTTSVEELLNSMGATGGI